MCQLLREVDCNDPDSRDAEAIFFLLVPCAAVLLMGLEGIALLRAARACRFNRWAVLSMAQSAFGCSTCRRGPLPWLSSRVRGAREAVRRAELRRRELTELAAFPATELSFVAHEYADSWL